MRMSLGRRDEYILGKERIVECKSEAEQKVHVWGLWVMLRDSFYFGG